MSHINGLDSHELEAKRSARRTHDLAVIRAFRMCPTGRVVKGGLKFADCFQGAQKTYVSHSINDRDITHF